MATFTWQPTSGTTGWETNGAGGWGGTPRYNGADAFVINGGTALTINAIGGTGSDEAGTVIVDNANATLLMDTTNGPQVNVGTSLVLNAGTLNLGTQGQMFMGGLVPATITLGPNALITNTGGPTSASYIFDGGLGTAIQGSGTILANQGLLDIQLGVTVAAGATTQFQIASNGVLQFDDSVNGGSITFLGSSGLLLLTAAQVGDQNILSGGTFGATIAGLTVGGGLTNGIDIEAVSGLASASLSGVNNDILTVTDLSSHTYTFNLIGDYTGASAQFSVDGINGGFDVFLVCYAAGTAILTDHGEVVVEAIRPGDRVMTSAGGCQVPQPVKWVGHRDLDLTRHPKPDAIAPIRIMQDALEDSLPRRDLVVSPDHCLFIDGALYPAKLLVNGMTIIRDLTARAISYHHIELEKHAVVFAEGVAAESYLDTGNRAFFSNAGVATMLHPELSINENLRCWEEDACAKLTVKPDEVRPVWQRFADRAVALGHTIPTHATTKDAGVHLVVDGKITRPVTADGATIRFMVPANARSVRLVSRSSRPSALTPWLDDPRDLGIAIRSVTLRDRTGEAVMGADHPALLEGWHAVERGPDGAPWRWTAGDAVLPIEASGPCMVEIALGGTITYIREPGRLAA